MRGSKNVKFITLLVCLLNCIIESMWWLRAANIFLDRPHVGQYWSKQWNASYVVAIHRLQGKYSVI
jgi:hypothetical protein